MCTGSIGTVTYLHVHRGVWPLSRISMYTREYGHCHLSPCIEGSMGIVLYLHVQEGVHEYTLSTLGELPSFRKRRRVRLFISDECV